MQNDDWVEETQSYLAGELATRKIAYIHFNDSWTAGQPVLDDAFLKAFRTHFPRTIILAGRMTFEMGEQLVEAGREWRKLPRGKRRSTSAYARPRSRAASPLPAKTGDLP